MSKYYLLLLSLVVSLVSYGVEIDPGYYYISSARSGNNAVYVGNPEIPSVFEGSVDNSDPNRGCWTYNKGWEMPEYVTTENTKYLFKISLSDAGNYYIENVGTGRYMGAETRHFHNIITTTTPDEEFEIYACDGCDDHFIIHPLSTEEVWHAAHDCNGLVMWNDTDDEGSHWVLTKIANPEHVISFEQVMVGAKYTIRCPRGALTVNVGHSALQSEYNRGVAFNSNNTDYQFKFLQSDNGDLYLYSVGADKYVVPTGALVASMEDATPIYFRTWSGTNTCQLYWDSGHNLNFGGAKQVAIDTWKNEDDGNRFSIDMQVDELCTYVAQVINNPAGGIIYNSQTYTDAQSFKAKNVELSEIEAVPVEGYATRVTINWDGSRYLITVNYIAVDEELPGGHQVVFISSREESAIVPGNWYVMTQIRGGETPVYDAGDGQTMRREVAANTVETLFPGTVANNSKYMVRFLSTTDENGYNIQFANGNYWSHMSTSSSATDAMYYMVHPATQTTAGAPSANGWALIWTPDFVNYGSRVDNNAAGGTMSYWQSGDFTSGQNNVFYLYNVDLVTEIQYTVHINNEAASVEINGQTLGNGEIYTTITPLSIDDIHASTITEHNVSIVFNGYDITVTYTPWPTYTVSIVGSEEGSLIYDGQTYTNEQTFTVSALDESLLSAGEVEGKQTIISIEDGVITITYVGPDWTDQGTLKFSPAMTKEGEFAEGTVFYTIQNKSNSRYLRSNSKSGDNLAFATLTENGYSRWAILGNATDGFQFVNKETKEAIALTKFEGPTLTSANLADASVSYLTDNLNDGSTRFAITTHFKEDNYWVITAADNHYYYWNMLSGKLGYWYSGKGYEYGYYGWARNASNGTGDPGSSFRFTEVETLETINYTLTITGVENGSITVGDDTYTDGAEFSHLGTLTEDQIIPEAVVGYTVAVVINGTDITVTYTPCHFPSASTYYVYIENHETNRMPFLYNDITYSDEITLQGANLENKTNGYVWKVTSNGNGYMTVLNAENGKGIKAIGCITTPSITDFQYVEGNNIGYYHLLSPQLNYFGSNDRLNCANDNGAFHNEAGLRAVTMYNAARDAANDWRFREIDVTGLTEYTVEIEGANGYVTFGTDRAANGGFFLAPVINEEDITVADIPGYVHDMFVEGNTIVVTYTLTAIPMVVTYNIYADGEIVDTKVVEELDGCPTTFALRNVPSYVTVTGIPKTAHETIVDVQTTTDWAQLPFVPGADHFYTLKVNYPNAKSIYVDPTDGINPRINIDPDVTIDNQDYFKWSFIGNWYTGFALLNKQTQSYVTFTTNNPYLNSKVYAVLTDVPADGAFFDLVQIEGNNNLRIHGTTMETCIFDRSILDSSNRLGSNVSGTGSTNSIITIEEALQLEGIDVTISDKVEYTTFYCDHAVTIPADVEVYTVARNGNFFTPTKLEGVIPTNTGVVVKGEKGHTYTFFTARQPETPATSDLQGVVTDTNAANYEGDLYVLSATKVSEGVYGNVGFYRFVGSLLAHHKAFYQAPEGSEVRAFAIDFGTEGIIDITTGERVEGSFDLQGRPVSKNAKSGLYIIGGKKMMKK